MVSPPPLLYLISTPALHPPHQWNRPLALYSSFLNKALIACMLKGHSGVTMEVTGFQKMETGESGNDAWGKGHLWSLGRRKKMRRVVQRDGTTAAQAWEQNQELDTDHAGPKVGSA